MAKTRLAKKCDFCQNIIKINLAGEVIIIMNRQFQTMLKKLYGILVWQLDASGRLKDESDAIGHQVQRMLDQNDWVVGNYPSILEDQSGLFWIKCPYGAQFVLLGPIIISQPNRNQALRRLQQLQSNHHAQWRAFLKQLPLNSLNLVFEVARMAAFLLNNQIIEAGQIDIQNASSQNAAVEPVAAKKHENAYENETMIADSIRQGIVPKVPPMAGGMHDQTVKALDQVRINVLTLNFVCSRAAMQGGLPTAIAYDLADDFAKRCLKSQTLAEMMLLSTSIVNDFAQQVQRLRNHDALTPPIQHCLAYLSAHFDQLTTLEKLAKMTGYSPNYLSREFNRQVGCSITDYVRQRRIEIAGRWLLHTTKSISEIGSQLHFSSPSYFALCFKRVMGMTPSQYRETQSINQNNQ